MKKILVLTIAGFVLNGCSSPIGDAKTSQIVQDQQEVYNKNQPIPFFSWSLQKDLWTKYYLSLNDGTNTWTVIESSNGKLEHYSKTVGHPIPKDTQLTNPQYITTNTNASGYHVLPQAEPDGLFTSQHTDATIIFEDNEDGTVAPIYTEQKATSYPYPVKYIEGQGWVKDGQSTFKINIKNKGRY